MNMSYIFKFSFFIFCIIIVEAQNNYLPLNNGYEIPVVGYGTYDALSLGSDEPLEVALEAGYRHIDTSPINQNEVIIGNVINRWITSGKLSRSDLFLVTSLPPAGMRSDLVSKFLKESLQKLQVDYVDLYLILSPIGLQYVEGQLYPVTGDGSLALDLSTNITEVYKKMEEQVDLGLTKSIGLSNFNKSQVERILSVARIPPVVIQAEVHLYYQGKNFVKFCKEHNIVVTAYSPLGAPGFQSSLPSNNTFNELQEPLVMEFATKYNKNPAQILLRFALQKGLVIIPKSKTPTRIKQNIDIFDFELDEKEMEILENLDKGKNGRIPFFDPAMLNKHPEYPF